MKIIVSENGPYLVKGNVPLYIKHIVSKNGLSSLKTIKKLDTPEEYALCRCGESTQAPFCSGAHIKTGFVGAETAGMSRYLDRAEILEGKDLNLLDDNRCAFARFCHKPHGDVWTLTEQSANPQFKKEAIQAATECPTGRLVAMLKSGEFIEDDLEPCISIVQDIIKGVSAGIFVTGGIPIESETGQTYEVRNREALCRCGMSSRKPFCDATHVSVGFDDQIQD